VSNGQAATGELDNELRYLAARNCCTRPREIAAKKRFKLARDTRAFEMRLGRKLNTAELMQIFSEWYRPSEPILTPTGACDDHSAAFLAEVEKVRVPTGQGALTKAWKMFQSFRSINSR
jgi:hypothetical protein